MSVIFPHQPCPLVLKCNLFFATPDEETHDEIIEIIQRFGRSALICKKAGFSGIEIHTAHGYLINQFLSPLHNLRNDEWGGTPEKRRNFLMDVYTEIRKQVGEDFPVAIKLNSADCQKGGFIEEDSLEVITAGIDLIEISGGTYESGIAKGAQKSSTIARKAFFIDLAEKVRAQVKIPLMVTGGFRSVDGMNQALESNAFDVVEIKRLMAIDADAPKYLLAGTNSKQTVHPIKTGIKKIDSLGIMDVIHPTTSSYFSR